MKISPKTITLFLLLGYFFLFLTRISSYGQEDTVTDVWLTYRGNPEHTGKTQLLGPPEEIEMKWRWRVNDEASPISASPAVTSDGTIYIATEGGYIAAINPEEGPGWIYNVSDPLTASPSANDTGEVLAITSDGYVYYLDSRGELQWKSDFAIDIASSPVLAQGVAYVGTDDKSLLAISLSPVTSGIERESKKLLKSDVIQWSFLAEGTVKSSPAFSGNTVFFGGGDYLYAINPNAGSGDNNTSQLKWKFDINAEMYSSPAVYGGRVYIGADDGYLYVLSENVSEETDQGELLWKRKTGGSLRSSPAIDELDEEVIIYIGSDDGKLYAIDEYGELQWTFSTFGAIRSSPAIDGNGDIYFGSDDGYIYALFPDGSLKWKFKTLKMVRSSPAIGPDMRLYVGSHDGYLYCIGESTKENQEPDINVDVSLSLSSIENEGNPTTISVSITSESNGQNVLSQIASVTLDLSPLKLLGCRAENIEAGVDNQTCVPIEISQEVMFDDGHFEDDVAGDGLFTYAFGITDESLLGSYKGGIFNHILASGLPGVGPVGLMVTVTDLFGNRVSKPFALNIVQKNSSIDISDNGTISLKNNLERQTLNISFTSGKATILSVTPNTGAPGQRVNIAILGQNTNFRKNRTRVEIFNDKGTRIASALPEDDDVDVLSDTALSAVLNILSTDQVHEDERLIGRWDVTVTTGTEVVTGADLFEITGLTTRIDAPVMQLSDYIQLLQNTCVFTLDITNENGARAEGSPWKINTGYSREIIIEDARRGVWNFDISIGDCGEDVSFKILTTGSNFGFLVGEVRNAITSQGIDNATITALTGEGFEAEANSTVTSGGGYYLLPLSAAEENYTVIASKTGMIDIEREIEIEEGTEYQQNFSLRPELKCPLSELTVESDIMQFYRFRDDVLMKTPEGRRWAELYYHHAPEVQWIILKCPGLRKKSINFINKLGKAIPELLLRGNTSCNLRTDIQELINLLVKQGSSELRRSLITEKEIIDMFLMKIEGK